MAHQAQLKSLQTSYNPTLKAPWPTSASLKIKTLLQPYIFHHVSHVLGALASAKSRAIELLKKMSQTSTNYYSSKLKRKRKKFFSSLTMHLNFSSSHVIPVSEPPTVASQVYYDSTWNSIIVAEGDEDMEPPLSGYPQWLEEKSPEDSGVDDNGSEIDRLAEKFIARCHEKFRLEKVESYRRYQEMLARSI